LSDSLFPQASLCIKQLLSLQGREGFAGAAAPLRWFCAPRPASVGTWPVGETGASLAPTWQQQNTHPFFCKVATLQKLKRDKKGLKQ